MSEIQLFLEGWHYSFIAGFIGFGLFIVRTEKQQ